MYLCICDEICVGHVDPRFQMRQRIYIYVSVLVYRYMCLCICIYTCIQGIYIHLFNMCMYAHVYI